MTQAKILRLILGDQLNESHYWFKRPKDAVVYVMMEIRQETDYVMHHVQKIAAFFAAMRAFADRLKSLGHLVIYIHLDDPANTQTIEGNIKRLLKEKKFGRFEYLHPDEYRLDVLLSELADRLPLDCRAVDSEHFLTRRDELQEFFKSKKRYLMESFYHRMRRQHEVLMDKGKPAGGKWNYDQKNRENYDGRVPIPKSLFFANDVTDICRMIQKKKVKTFGEIEPEKLIWPTTRKQALSLLEQFVQKSLPAFGTYQDAMTLKSWYLFHSRLSFALNTKMLSPQEIIAAAIGAYNNKNSKIQIQQIEGFIRQILGWREYMRGIYWALMPEFESMNYFNHNAALPEFYWTADTGMRCLKAAIGQSLQHAYAHHIQRLMVTGNFALLAGVHPDQVDAWYLGVYIDAVQWVELPNTRAMSQFADGGLVATKPYVSSAKYIHTMSDYCESCEYDWQKRHGQMACPFNSMYWYFFERHRSRLQKNPRVAMMYRVWDRMQRAERRDTLKQAEYYHQRLNRI